MMFVLAGVSLGEAAQAQRWSLCLRGDVQSSRHDVARGSMHLPVSWSVLPIGTSWKGAARGMWGLTEALQRAPVAALLGALHWSERSEGAPGVALTAAGIAEL